MEEYSLRVFCILNSELIAGIQFTCYSASLFTMIDCSLTLPLFLPQLFPCPFIITGKLCLLKYHACHYQSLFPASRHKRKAVLRNCLISRHRLVYLINDTGSNTFNLLYSEAITLGFDAVPYPIFQSFMGTAGGLIREIQ